MATIDAGRVLQDLRAGTAAVYRLRRLYLEDVQEVTVLCGVRRVELAGYRELFAHWQGNHQGASIKRVTGHWLSWADEIDSEIRKIILALE